MNAKYGVGDQRSPEMGNSRGSDTRTVELASWKQIADYLGVNVRTAQKWEIERGLPIHRLPGKRGLVFARPDELDGWKNSGQPNGKGADEAGTTGSTGDSEQSVTAQAKRVFPWRLAAAILVLVLAGGLLAFRFLPRKGQPFSFRVEPNALIISDDSGKELWRKPFATRLDTTAYEGGSLVRFPAIRIADLDGDGNTEVLFSPRFASYREPRPLFCFSRDGAEKWRFVPGRTIATSRESFEGPFLVETFSLLTVTGRRRIVVSSRHHTYYPTQLALLDADGRLLHEYWHSGHLNHLRGADVDGDGKPEIYAGGISNAYRRATLVVLDPDDFGGASSEANSDYQLLGLPPEHVRGRVLFPRTCINRRENPYNGVFEIWSTPSYLGVEVDEVLDNQLPVIYHLNALLAPIHAEYSNTLEGKHLEMRAAGLLDHDLSPKEEEELRKITVLVKPPGELAHLRRRPLYHSVNIAFLVRQIPH